MREARARVAPRHRGDLLRLAEQEPQHVEMVHAHVGERQPLVAGEKPLPVRDGVHVDLREHRLAQRPPVEELLQHPHRLVVAHVLVDRHRLSRRRRRVAHRDRLAERQRQRLLRQHPPHMRLPERMPDQLRLPVRRKGEVDDLDLPILDQRLGGRVHLRDPPPLRHPPRVRLRARGDRHHREPRLPVGREVALRHDHAGADAADPDVARPHRHVRLEAARHPQPPPEALPRRNLRIGPRPWLGPATGRPRASPRAPRPLPRPRSRSPRGSPRR